MIQGIGYLEKKVLHSVNKGLDLLENFSRENFFEIDVCLPFHN